MSEVRRILRLHVVLDAIDPPIWRLLEVAADLTLVDLHVVLQRAFGWAQMHLWSVEADGVTYGPDDGSLGFTPPTVTLDRAIRGLGARLTYLYDFGDEWRHTIEVRTDELKVAPDATCLDGARAAPPEDCGGPPGYARLLDALSNPSHPEHSEILEWSGPIDPEAFDLARVDAQLREPLQEAGSALGDPHAELIELLDREKLPDEVRDELGQLGPSLAPILIDILVHPDLFDSWAPIHAVTMLADLGAADAVEPMLEMLECTDWMDRLHDRIILDLPRLGSQVIGPALTWLDDVEDEDTRSSILAVLATCGVRDRRIYDHLVREFHLEPTSGSGLLGDYGDPAALPLLVASFESTVPDGSNDSIFIEVADAIEVLGGQLSADQTRKLDVARALRRDRMAPRRSPRVVKVGRNDPCPCGSGKKYKKCHLK